MTKAKPTKADGSVVGKFGEGNAAKAFAKMTSHDLVDQNISPRFSGSPAADRKQAAADAKAMTAEPKPGKKPVGISWR